MQLSTLGNEALLKLQKTAFMAPSKIATLSVLKCYDWAQMMCRENRCVVSGFSSKLEKEVLHFLLKGNQPIIMVIGRKMYSRLPEGLKLPLEQERLLIISITNEARQSKQNAFKRNCYITELAEKVVFPCVPPEESSLYSIYDTLLKGNKSINILYDTSHESKSN